MSKSVVLRHASWTRTAWRKKKSLSALAPVALWGRLLQPRELIRDAVELAVLPRELREDLVQLRQRGVELRLEPGRARVEKTETRDSNLEPPESRRTR